MCSIFDPVSRPARFESLNDPVDVLTVFVDGKVKPLRFRWQGRSSACAR